MNSFSISDLDLIIRKNLEECKKHSKVLIDYMLFGELMNDTNFYSEIINSALNATKRSIKPLKSKLPQMNTNFILSNLSPKIK
ncbi:hypothetical protein D3C71_1358250 [compost metagenome]